MGNDDQGHNTIFFILSFYYCNKLHSLIININQRLKSSVANRQIFTVTDFGLLSTFEMVQMRHALKSGDFR